MMALMSPPSSTGANGRGLAAFGPLRDIVRCFDDKDHGTVVHDWLLRDRRRTFSPFHRGVVTTYALEVGAAGDGNNRNHSLAAFRAARYPIHENLPIFAPTTQNWKFCSIRAFRPKQED